MYVRSFTMIVCPSCPGTQFKTLRMLLKHIRVTHSHSSTFHMRCNFQGCKRSFHNFHSYKNHIWTFHDVTDSELSSDRERDEESSTISDDDHFPSPDHSLGVERVDFSMEDTSTIDEQSLQQAAATWILKTRERHRIPLSVFDEIISDMQSFFQVCLL